MRQNQSIILGNACDPPAAWDVCRQPVQVAAPASSRESLSPASAQHCPKACTSPSAASWERPGVAGMDDLALAKAARFGPRCWSVASSRVSGLLAQDRVRPAGELAVGQGGPELA